MNTEAHISAVSEDLSILVRRNIEAYPRVAPFHPNERYLEYPHGDCFEPAQDNPVYAAVRDLFLAWGLDRERAGTPQWNPLGDFIEAGDHVVVKPNMVLDLHPSGGDIDCLITHGSVIRPVLDYVFIALGGQGRVTVGDSPLQGTDFDASASASGLDRVVDFFNQETALEVLLVDFRQVHAFKDGDGNILEWREVTGDPRGYVTFELGYESALSPLSTDSAKFRVAKYKAKDTMQYHSPRAHRYVVAGSIIDADVIISMPKLKTHCKAGVTLGLKNFVGTIGRKQCLAHHREGSPSRGGDEYSENSALKHLNASLGEAIQGNPSRVGRALATLGWKVTLKLMKWTGISFLGDGSWHGNDTVWRMVHDLVKIATYGKKDGQLSEVPQRRIITILDGIVSGENEGPLESTPKHTGVLIAGTNPAVTDLLTTTWMGYDWRKIPLLRALPDIEKCPLLPVSVGVSGYQLSVFSDQCSVISDQLSAGSDQVSVNHGECRSTMTIEQLAVSQERETFVSPEGWFGHIEITPANGPPITDH